MLEELRRRIDRTRAAWQARRKANRGVLATPAARAPVAYQGSVHDPLLAVEDAVALTRRRTYAAVFEVTGVPVDGMSPEDAEAFLTHWAGCLNTLRHKHGIQFVAHNRPGGLAPYVRARREALARHHTQHGGRGLGAPLAVLERDQVEHLARLDADGRATSVRFCVVVDAPDRETLKERGTWAASWLRSARLGARVLEGPELADALSWSLRGEAATHWGQTAAGWVLVVDQANTPAERVTVAPEKPKKPEKGEARGSGYPPPLARRAPLARRGPLG